MCIGSEMDDLQIKVQLLGRFHSADGHSSLISKSRTIVRAERSSVRFHRTLGHLQLTLPTASQFILQFALIQKRNIQIYILVDYHRAAVTVTRADKPRPSLLLVFGKACLLIAGFKASLFMKSQIWKKCTTLEIE
jgi:hypothetical protein